MLTARACQSCHRWPEDELKARVETIQARTFEMRNTAMDALMTLIADIKSARDAGAAPGQLEAARACQRRAQFLLDFVRRRTRRGFTRRRKRRVF